MVKNCCVLGCTSNTKRNPAISFFRFPTDVTLASMWLQLIGRPDFKPSQYSVICQLHFTREDFTSGSHHYPITGIGGQRKRLKTKAIPTQNLNGCTNPELLAELQMRAKNTIPQKLPKVMSSANTMVNANMQKNNEAVQLQQLLTSLMPALFGTDNNHDSGVQSQSSPMINSNCSPATSLASVFSNGMSSSSPPFSATTFSATPPTVAIATTQGPIISLPSSLQSIQLDNNTIVQGNASSVLQPTSHMQSEAIMSTPILKKEPSNADHAIFKISNGSPALNTSTASPQSNGNYMRANGSATDDLYTELQNSLMALKNNVLTENHNSIMNSNTNSYHNNANILQPVARDVPMETGNNTILASNSNSAYIIDVDTYQKLMETVSQKSEKSIQTEKDATINTLEAENKQLKEQLSQYELAFNSLINWTEGSLKTDPVAQPQNENKLVEGKLIE